MVNWNLSQHPISDIRDWSRHGRLELQPDFQRRQVWSVSARIMLMDTILSGIPMPKIYLANSIRESNTYRIVIDGQQRITAILDFLHDEFALEDPYTGEFRNKTFSELNQESQDEFLSYSIHFNEARNPTDEETREVYSRVNKYTVPLSKQELRRADFPGDFLDVSEKLALDTYLDEVGVFTPATRRRYADVEYVSELLAAMIDGIQDKKHSLDTFYRDYSQWDNKHNKDIIGRFSEVLRELNFIFDDSLSIAKTRFRQKADFYTLFLVIDEYRTEGYTVEGKDLSPLRSDIKVLDETIRPESEIEICSEYAIKCVSQANSAASRRWRHSFIRSILGGTYAPGRPDDHRAVVFYGLIESLSVDNSGMCPDPNFSCPLCDNEIRSVFDGCVIGWNKSSEAHQVTNATWIHSACLEDQTEWLVLERPNDA